MDMGDFIMGDFIRGAGREWGAGEGEAKPSNVIQRDRDNVSPPSHKKNL